MELYARRLSRIASADGLLITAERPEFSECIRASTGRSDLALVLAITWPFIKPLLPGVMLAGLCHPLYGWLTRCFRGRKSLASFTTLLILLVLVVGPIGAFVGIVIGQALEVSEKALHLGAGTFRGLQLLQRA